MGAYSCPVCAVMYPLKKQYRYCQVCHTDLAPPVGDAPDDDWEERVKMARDALGRPPPDEDAEYRQLKQEVMLYKDQGVLWVNSHDLIRAGLGAAPKDFECVQFPDGTVIEFQGADDPNRRWWVEIVTQTSEQVVEDTDLEEKLKPYSWPYLGKKDEDG